MSSRQDVMLAALTLSFLEGLEQDGIERRYAIELTGDVYWHLYRQAGYVTRAATRLITRDPVIRTIFPTNELITARLRSD